MRADDPAAIEPWLADMAAALAPAGRKRLATKIGQAVRRLNAARIARNIQPDGSAMAPRKPRRRSGKVKAKAKMFGRLKAIRNMKLRSTPDGVDLSFAGGSARVAAEHHYGLEAVVGKTKSGGIIRTRYTERRLFGFGPEDRAIIADAAIDHLGK